MCHRPDNFVTWVTAWLPRPLQTSSTETKHPLRQQHKAPYVRAVSAVSGKGFSVSLQVGDWGRRGLVYGHNNGSISSGDRVSTVINHMLWFWPHQGTSTQETETPERYHTHQRLSSAGGAGLQASLLQSGCTALALRSCQMLALLECLMIFANSRADAGIEQRTNKRGSKELRRNKGGGPK